MTQKSRRRALKGIAVTLPAAWSPPLVKSVVLPAHAQATGCAAPEDCYETDDGSFAWPGGGGLRVVTVFSSSDCDGTGRTSRIVAAPDQETAGLLCDGPVSGALATDPEVPGCSFFACGLDKGP